jgi:hypothetical protein
VTALIAWPRFHSARAEPQGAKQMAAPAEPRTPNLHRANRSLLESADGSMATVATRREKTAVSRNQNRIDLTPTGPLMEDDYTQVPRSPGKMSVTGSLLCSVAYFAFGGGGG